MAVNPSRTGDQQKGQQEEKPVFWSFVQVRGSVPLFWSQNPAGLRPPIVLEGDPAENLGRFVFQLMNHPHRFIPQHSKF
jgi:hypothetical protein